MRPYNSACCGGVMFRAFLIAALLIPCVTALNVVAIATPFNAPLKPKPPPTIVGTCDITPATLL